MIETIPVPMVWVIPPDLLMNPSSKGLGASIGQHPAVRVWEFEGGGVAFSLPDVLVRRGTPVNYELFLRRTQQLFQSIDKWAVPEPDALDLDIPGSQYWSRMLLKPEEKNARSCRYFKSELTRWEPFGFQAYSSYELDKDAFGSIREFLEEWFSTASSQRLYGESLCLGRIEMVDYCSPRTKTSYPESGYEVRCSAYTPCTWPWIDFYLRMRRSLSARKRLSVRFVNPIVSAP